MNLLFFSAFAQDPDFLEGCWSDAEAGSHTEVWSPRRGPIMVGGATSGRDEAPMYESIRLEREADGWAYYARPRGAKRATRFQAAETDGTDWVFENPKHDFPQRLKYRRAGETLDVVLEGKDDARVTLHLTRCGSSPAKPTKPEPVPCKKPNEATTAELAESARTDQEDRKAQNWDGMMERDAARLARVHVALKRRQVCNAEDAFNAGVVLQHSRKADDHALGYRLFGAACDSGNERACRWKRLAWDRYLVASGRPQWYGTQWVSKPDGDGMCAVAVDPRATDAEREADGAKPLQKFIERTYAMTGTEPAGTGYAALVDAGLVCTPEAWD